MKLLPALCLLLLLNVGLLLYAPPLSAQSPATEESPFNLFLPFVAGSNISAPIATAPVDQDPALVDEAFEEPGDSGDQLDSGSVTGAGNATTLLPTGYTTLKGVAGGQPVSNLHVQDQAGTQNDWDKYVEFQTPGSKKYIGYRSYLLSTTMAPSSITALQLNANYLGPAKAY